MIIIETPAPPTRERLVLVPADAVSRTASEPALNVHTSAGRDATPADLERGGYERLGPEVLRVSAAEWRELKLRAEGREAHGEPGTLAHLRADLRDAAKRAEKAEGLLVQRETELRLAREDGDERARDLRQAYERAVAAAEKAERERDEAKARAKAACELIDEVRAEAKDLRAELARLTLVDEEEPTVSWFYDTYCARPESTQQEDCADAYRLGVAHERARQQPAKDRATDEELLLMANDAYFFRVDAPATIDDMRGLALAVAARVRQERCLVAQAVARNADFHVTECMGGRWRVVVTDRDVNSKTELCAPAEVPATLARLLGEVSRG